MVGRLAADPLQHILWRHVPGPPCCFSNMGLGKRFPATPSRLPRLPPLDARTSPPRPAPHCRSGPGAGSHTCNECPAGFFAAGNATAQCAPCPKGTITANVNGKGATGCTPCKLGTYREEAAADNKCRRWGG